MKKTTLFILIAIIIVVGDVAFIKYRHNRQAEVREDQEVSTMIKEPARKLVETGGIASCFTAEIQTMDGETVKVPEEVQQVLSCLDASVTLSHDGETLAYSRPDEFDIIDVRTYRFSSGNQAQLMSFVETTDGLRCIWKEDDSAVACIAVNQQEYKGLTKLHVLEIDEYGMLKEKHDFSHTQETAAMYVCGAACVPEEFHFNRDRSVTYPLRATEGKTTATVQY